MRVNNCPCLCHDVHGGPVHQGSRCPCNGGSDPIDGAFAAPQCDPTKESRLSPVPHDYEVIGEDYGSLGDGGSYEELRCKNCGRTAYSMLPD